MEGDRRRQPGLRVPLDLTLEDTGRRWDGRIVDLSPEDTPISLVTNTLLQRDHNGPALWFPGQDGEQPKAGADSQEDGPAKERRKSFRVNAELNVTLDAEAFQWQGKTVNLSLFGLKVALPATASPLPVGRIVRLWLTGPNGKPPIPVKGIVWRKEAGGTALLLVELDREKDERLKALIESLRARQG